MNTKVLSLDEIKSLVDIPELILEIENGFVRYSQGSAVVPPVGFLSFDAREPLIYADHVQSGTHITAMGADDHVKQELDSDFLEYDDTARL